MRLSRRGWLAGLVAGVVAFWSGRQAAAADEDPILLVDGWILRQSDVYLLNNRDLLNDRQGYRRDS